MSKESKLSNVQSGNQKSVSSIFDDGRSVRDSQYKRVVWTIIIFTCIAWLLGHWGFNIYWLSALITFVFLWWKCKISWLLELVCKDADLEARRDGAFNSSETVEWLNFIINRWVIFSDESLLLLIKNNLDPLLESCLPPFISSIEVSDFTLGKRTPYIHHVTAYDNTEDLQKLRATAFNMRHPPKDLLTRPKYRAVLDLDVGLSSPDARFVIRIRLGNKGLLGAETDIAVEDFHISGRMQLVLQFNRNIPFPHLASLSFCFLDEPQVAFDIRVLKAVQLMDVPLVRQWLSQTVNDLLKLSLVDPDRIYIPLCEDPDELARGEEFACGVLSLAINGGSQGRPTDDPYWCSVSIGQQKIHTKDVTLDSPWTEDVSLLVYNLYYDRLTIKIKGKRKLGTKYTVAQYEMPLARMYLDSTPTQEKVFEKSNAKESSLLVQMEYTALPLVCLPSPSEDEVKSEEELEEWAKNISEKANPELEDVSGVVLVAIHSGESLIPMDKNGSSDPYCVLYANRNIMHKTNVIEECLDPVWDAVTEFTVAKINQMTLSFVVLDSSDDFIGSCNLKLSKDTPVILRKELHLLYKVNSVLKSSGKLCVSVVFRPISSVRKSWKPELPGGFPEGEPIDQFQKDDPKLMEALLMAERGGLTVTIHRGRNLVAMDITGKSDPFVTLRTDESAEKFRSKVIQKTLNPVWNETVTIAMPSDGEHLILDAWDKDALSQEKMGSAVFKTSTLRDLTKDPYQKHWVKLSNAKSGEIQLSFKHIPPEECQIEMNNNIMQGEPELISPEDLNHDAIKSTGWKKILKKRRVFGIAGSRKKTTPSLSINVPNGQTQQTLLQPASPPPSSASSHEVSCLSDDENKNHVKTEPLTLPAENLELDDSKRGKPKLMTVVNSVKTLKCSSPRMLSDEECAEEENLDEIRMQIKEKVKAKRVRRRFGSWRLKKQRSASDGDMAACGLEKEFTQDRELSKAWLDTKTSDTNCSPKLKKNNSFSSNRNYSSPVHSPITRGHTIAGRLTTE